MEQKKETSSKEKQRHGCVTAWLILMIILNSIISLLYFFAGDIIIENSPADISNTMIIVLAVFGTLNVLFSIMLFKWKKWVFWGFVVTAVATFAVNLSIGLGIGQSILGLVGIAVLYGVLQIKKDNISTWTNLE